MDVASFTHRIKLTITMSNFTTRSNLIPADSSFRWIISHATSFHPDYGPDLIAVRIDAQTVTLLREFLDNLHHIVVRGRAMARLQWLGARVEFLREAEEALEPGGALDSLSEDAALILPPGVELPASCLAGYDMRSECDSFTMLRVSEQFDPEVFSSARIKHTGIEVESKHDLWPMIDAAFPTLHAALEARIHESQAHVA
jgi:hypothetical protein